MKFAPTLLLISLIVAFVSADLPVTYNFNKQFPACAPTIRNQGGCYSAWADNLVDSFASRLCKAYNGNFFQEMSLQQLMDCPQYISGTTTLDSHGCAGAFTDSVLANLNRAAGGYLVAESCNPYVSQFHTFQDWATRYPRGPSACSDRCYSTGDSSNGVPARKYYFNEKTLLTSVEAMKQSLMDNGPLPVGLYLYSSFYNLNYTHHDYDPQPSEQLLGSHGALIFGWDGDYWLMQNSWDLTWGHDGNFRAKIGNNLTQIETYFDNATIDATPEVPDFMFKSPRAAGAMQAGQQYRVEWVSRVEAATVQVELHTHYYGESDWLKEARYYILANGVDNTAGHGSIVVTLPGDLSTYSSSAYYFVVRNGTHTGESERFRVVDKSIGFINDVITPDFGPADNFGARAALYQPHYTKDRIMTVRWSSVATASTQTVEIAAVKLDGSTVVASVSVPNTGIYRWKLPSLCNPGSCERSYMLRLYASAFSSYVYRYSFPFKYYQYSMQWDFAEDIAGASYRDNDVLTLTPTNTTTNSATGVQVWIGADYPTAFKSAYLESPPNASSIVINATELLPTRYASVFMTSAVMGASYVEALPIVITDAQTVTVATDVASAVHGQTVVFTWTTTGKFFDYVDIILVNGTSYEFPILLGLDASLGRFAYLVQPADMLADGAYTITIRNTQNHAVKGAIPAPTLTIAADPCSPQSNCAACAAVAGCGWCTKSSKCVVTTDNTTSLTAFCPIGAMSVSCSALPAPTISAVSPDTFPSYLPQTVTVTGTNFMPGAQVYMGGSGTDYAVLNQVVVDSTTITFTARIDSYSTVYVYNPDGQYASKSTTRNSGTCPGSNTWYWGSASSTKDGESGTIAISGTDYVANMNCHAKLYVYNYNTRKSGQQQTLFNFTLFDLAPGDSLTLFNGNGDDKPVIATFTSTSTRRTAYCSDYSNCYLRFLSGSGDKTGHSGFSVDYMTVSVSGQCPASSSTSYQSVTGTTGTIELKASEYTDYMDCQWRLYKSYLTSDGNVFKVTVDHIETEKDADFVRIYNGQNSNDASEYPLVAELSGTNITESYILDTDNTGQFTVRFTSNELLSPVSSTKGFKLTWEIVDATPLAGTAPCPTDVGDLTAPEGELVINATHIAPFMQCTYTIAPAGKEGGQTVSFGITANGLLSDDTITFFDGSSQIVQLKGGDDRIPYSSSTPKVCQTGPCTVQINTNAIDRSGLRGALRIFWNLASTTDEACPLRSGKTFADRDGAIIIAQQDQANLKDHSSKYCGYTIAPAKSADEVVVFSVDMLETYGGFDIYNGADDTADKIVSSLSSTPSGNWPFLQKSSCASSSSCPVMCTAAKCYITYHNYYYIENGGILRWHTISKNALDLFRAPSTAGQTFTAPAGTLTVSNDEYVGLMDAYWIVAPEGKTASQMVVFTVNYAAIAYSDTLYIYDGSADSAPTVLSKSNIEATMPGYSSNNAILPVACSASSCRVRLVTGRSRWLKDFVRTAGFSLSWKLEENRCATKRSCGKCQAVPGCSWCQSSTSTVPGHCASYREEYSLYGLCGSSTAGWSGSWYDFGSSTCAAFSGPDPVVSSITPSSTKTGVATQVVIKGTNFHNTTAAPGAVTICGSYCTDAVFTSETEITCTAPVFSSAAYCEVVVWNDAIQPSDDFYSFVYIGSGPQPGAVTVAAVSPSAGSRLGGTRVTITGSGFASGATVKFCESAATAVTVVSATSITCTTPARTSAGICAITVTNTDGHYGVLGAAFTFTPEGQPTPVTPPSQVGAIVGGVVGGVGGAAIIAAIIIIACCCCKKKDSGDSYKSANRARPDAGAPMTANPMRSQA